MADETGAETKAPIFGGGAPLLLENAEAGTGSLQPAPAGGAQQLLGQLQNRTPQPSATGFTPLEDLLRCTARNAAQHLLDQLKTLQLSQASVKDLPVFKLAGTLRTASTEQKHQLVTHLAQGFPELDVGQRVEVIRLVLSIQAAASQPEDMKRCAKAKALSDSMVQKSPFTRNLLELMSEAGMTGESWDPRVYEAYVASAGRTLGELGLCQLFQAVFEPVTELAEKDRSQLMKAIVECDELGLDEPQQEVLQRTIQCGGYADECLYVYKFISKWGVLCCVVPFLELFLSLVLEPVAPLVVWIRADAVLWIITVITAYLLKMSADRLLVEAFNGTSTDDSLAKSTNHEEDTTSSSASEDASLCRKLAIVCVVSLSLVALFLLAGALAGLAAAWEVLTGFFAYASIATWVFCLAFDSLRLVATPFLGYVVIRTLHEVFCAQRSVGKLSAQESERVANYGAVV